MQKDILRNGANLRRDQVVHTLIGLPVKQCIESCTQRLSDTESVEINAAPVIAKPKGTAPASMSYFPFDLLLPLPLPFPLLELLPFPFPFPFPGCPFCSNLTLLLEVLRLRLCDLGDLAGDFRIGTIFSTCASGKARHCPSQEMLKHCHL